MPFRSVLRSALAGVALLAGFAMAGPAHALAIIGGNTQVTLAAAPVFAGANVAIGLFGTATIQSVNGDIPTVNFPITGGELIGSNALIEHDNSGLEFSRDMAGLRIRDFLIDTAQSTIFGNVDVLTIQNGNRTVDATLTNVALFGIGTGLSLSLTDDSAGAFNDLFALGLTGGTVVGSATTSPTAIPEPATWAQMLLGFLGVALVLRARARRAAAWA